MNAEDNPIVRPPTAVRSLVHARRMSRRDTLRRFFAGAAGLLPSGTNRVKASEAIPSLASTAQLIDSALPKDPPVPVHSADFGIVGVYDIDWLATPQFTRLLDYLAASPRAFRAVRCFGALTSGIPD